MDLKPRAHAVLRLIVEYYCRTGEPAGSRVISAHFETQVSPATVRNIMAELEELGLIYSPHTSAGRLPTEAGLRYFVNSLCEDFSVREEDKINIHSSLTQSGRSMTEVIEDTASLLSALSKGMGLMFTTPTERVLKHIELLPLDQGRALVVLVGTKGQVENRIIEIPLDIETSTLLEAANYLNSHLSGRTLREARLNIQAEFEADRTALNTLAAQVVRAGLALLKQTRPHISYVMRGQSNLLRAVQALPDVERLQSLFDALEAKESLLSLLDAVIEAEGVQIFIGSESAPFTLTECSIVMAPCHNPHTHTLGAIGVIGPTSLDYARVIPVVEYAARQISRTLG